MSFSALWILCLVQVKYLFTFNWNYYSFHFRGGAVKHFALAHNGLQKFLAEMSEERGLSTHFKNLVLQGVFRDAFKPPEVVKCELCDHEFVKEHLKTHQILKHFLVNYSEEVTQFHTQRGAGDCPVFDCQVRMNYPGPF